jgi:hypothetical protein
MSMVKWLGVALYAAVLVLAPFTHHDLTCHLKDPQHCTACTSNQVGTDPVALVAPGFRPLADAGRVILSYSLAEDVLLATDSTGRSPPPASI